MSEKIKIRHGLGGGWNEVEPDEELIKRMINLIENSQITLIKLFEYFMYSKDNDNKIDYSRPIYTGHKKITFYIQQSIKNVNGR